MPDKAANFPVDPVLTDIAVAYRNKKLIADEVLPRVNVGVQNFRYRKYDAADGLSIPDTVVGRTGRPKQVEFGFKEEDSSCLHYALDEPIPDADIENAPAGYDPLARATESTTDLIELCREKRVADLVFNAASYAAGNKTVLTGKDQYSNPESDPIKGILAKLDACLMRPNIMILGSAVWTMLRTHPKIVKATHGNSGDSGVAARQAVAELYELDKLLVGAAIFNSAKKGQEMTAERLWGNHIALIYQDEHADIRGRITFGFTAQFKGREVRQIPDEHIGPWGGKIVRVSESVRELITADKLGYFIQNAVA